MKQFQYLFATITFLVGCQHGTHEIAPTMDASTSYLITLIQNDSTIQKGLDAWGYRVDKIVVEDSTIAWPKFVFHFLPQELYDSLGPIVPGLADNNGCPLPYIFQDTVISNKFSNAEKQMLEDAARKSIFEIAKPKVIDVCDWQTKRLRFFRTQPLFVRNFSFVNIQVYSFEVELDDQSIKGEIWPILNLTYIFRKKNDSWELLKIHKFFYT